MVILMKRNKVILAAMIFCLCSISNSLPQKLKENRPHLIDPNLCGPQTEQVDLSLYKNVFYVSQKTGTDDPDRGTRLKPWKSLSFALSQIHDAEKSDQSVVLVATGIYTSTPLVMKPFIDLYGGFSPDDWTRNINENKSILDGQEKRRVVIGSDNARIDGFTITNGRVRGHGAGILCDDTSPVISNNRILNNMTLQPGDFNYNRIHQNGSHGGGIACRYNAVPEIRNNLIANNITEIGNGGGISFYGWLRSKNAPSTDIEDNFMVGGLRAVVEKNVIAGNISGVDDSHRTRSSNGGAISCAHESRPIIKNNIIIANQARGRSDAGGIYSEYYSYPTISGNWIIGNIGDDDGGGIYSMRLGHALIENNFIAGNYTTGGGVGGIRLSKEGRARIVNNRIVHNPGGGVMCVDSYMELERNIIMSNTGSAGVAYSTVFSYMQPSVIKENLIAENEKDSILVRNNAGPQLITGGNFYSVKTNKLTEPGSVLNEISGVFSQLSFEKQNYSTIIKTDFNFSQQTRTSLTGRVLRVGDRWGIIKSVSSGELDLWGDLSASGKESNLKEFVVLPEY